MAEGPERGEALAFKIAVAAMPGGVQPLPVNRRVQIIDANGWPEYRLLPRH
jgi:hypothetical protein